MATKSMTPIVALRQFFGMRPGETLQEFVAEVRQLSEEEKLELARAACEEMGTMLIAATKVVNNN